MKWGFSFRGVYFDQPYSPVAYGESLITNNDIATIHRLADMNLDVRNFSGKNVTIHERVCISTSLYYLYWFDKYYANVYLIRDDGPFFIQQINRIHEEKHEFGNIIG